MATQQSERQAVLEKFTAERRKWQESYGQTEYDSLGLQWRQANGVALCCATVTAGGRILDIGCGAGHASVELAKAGFTVVGGDIAQSMVDLGNENAAAAGVSDRTEFATVDFSSLDDSRFGRFDGILGLGFIEYFDDPVAVLERCRALLNPNGVVVIQFWNPRTLATRIDPVLLRSRSLLQPLRTLRRHRTRPDAPPKKSATAASVRDEDGVTHRRYTPAEAEALAREAKLTPLASTGSLFLSRKTPLADPTKARIDLWLQSRATRSERTRRLATDFILASKA